jgi:hypothetical protein
MKERLKNIGLGILMFGMLFLLGIRPMDEIDPDWRPHGGAMPTPWGADAQYSTEQDSTGHHRTER